MEIRGYTENPALRKVSVFGVILVHIFPYSDRKFELSLRIQSECEKIRTSITPNTNTFYAVQSNIYDGVFFTKIVN